MDGANRRDEMKKTLKKIREEADSQAKEQAAREESNPALKAMMDSLRKKEAVFFAAQGK